MTPEAREVAAQDMRNALGMVTALRTGGPGTLARYTEEMTPDDYEGAAIVLAIWLNLEISADNADASLAALGASIPTE